MNQELFEVQLAVRHQIMVSILEELGEPVHIVLASWLQENKEALISAELKFYSALGNRDLIDYEEIVQSISALEKRKARTRIKNILKKAKAQNNPLVRNYDSKEIDLIDILVHKLYSIRRLALKGAFEAVKNQIGAGSIPGVLEAAESTNPELVC